MKRISFFSAYNFKDRSSGTQNTQQTLAAVKYFKFAPWSRSPVYDMLISSANSVFTVSLDTTVETSFMLLRQIFIFTAGSIQDIVWTTGREGGFDLLCLSSDGQLARLCKARTYLF